MRDTSPARRILVISPHFDDAVLSCWATITNHHQTPVDVLTAFGGTHEGTASDWAASCGFDSAHEETSARQAEDRAALDGVASRTWSLPIADFSYGLRDEQKVRALISNALTSWLDEHDWRQRGLSVFVPAGTGYVGKGASTPSATQRKAAPQGRGGPALAWLRAAKHAIYLRRHNAALLKGALAHPDHILVRDIALDTLADRSSVALIAYEELPYLWNITADDAIAVAAQSAARTPIPFNCDVDQTRKAAALAHYESQLKRLDPAGRLMAADTLPPIERYWYLDQ